MSLQDWIMDGTPEDVVARYAGLSDAVEKADFGEYDENIVVIDTETTGVSIKREELTQIAAARLNHGEIIEWFVTFVNPGMPIPPDIVHLTNITDEDVADAPTPDDALTQLVEFVGDAKLVAHNAYFDRAFVTKHPSGYPLLENQWIDSLELSRIALPRMRSHRLIDLVTAFGAPLSTHRADDDVVATCALYRLLLAAVDAMPASLLAEIASWANPLEWPFGEIFTFFAKRNCDEDLVQDFTQANSKDKSRFSLSEMRQQRTSCLGSMQPKADAAGIPTSKMIEDMRRLGASIKTVDGNEPDTLAFPTDTELEDAFSEEGLLGNIYPDYEARTEQFEMARAVRDSFTNSQNLIVEAGTGTGKSMAYLVPCVLTAQKNNIGVGIATKTNALLDQLIYKELPALAQALPGKTITYAALKGFTHYPCLLKVQRILREGPVTRIVSNEERPQAPALAALLSFIEQTDYGDIDSLKIDFRTLPRASVTTTSNDCLRRRCPFYGTECFVHGSRKLAECADVVVTNHSLLFYDVAAGNSLLPPLRYWVVDEAHGAEEEARRALSATLSLDALAWLVKRVDSEDPRTNVLLAASRSAQFEGSADTLFHSVMNKAIVASHKFAEKELEFARATAGLLYFDEQKKSSYEMFDLWINDQVRASSHFDAVEAAARELIESAEKVVTAAQEIVALLDDAKGAGFAQREVASVALELKDAVQTADIIFAHPTDQYVYSVTLNRRDHKSLTSLDRVASRTGVAFHAQLYNVGAALDEQFYDAMRSVIYTSATLAVNGSFASFEESVGLTSQNSDRGINRSMNRGADRNTARSANQNSDRSTASGQGDQDGQASQSQKSYANVLELPSSFDFDANMRIFIVSDMPEPTSSAYIDHMQRFLVDAHISQGGSILTLFTNKRDMEHCFDVVYDELQAHELRVICQHRGVSTKWLRDEFVANEALSLFALKSFWEGFDAPGNTLRGVIIPKLPFKNPSDPLSLERKSRDDNSWKRWDLPKAVIEVRQAAGRLIRKANDTGVLILADSRLLTKWYGRIFVGSLPSKNVEVLPMQEICERLSRS